MHMLRSVWFCGFSLIVLALIGCGPSMGDVAGTVKIDGQPIQEGAIRFEDIDKKLPTSGGPITNGKYNVRVPPGTMKVAISSAKVVGKKKLYDKADSPTMDLKAEALPEKYSDHEKTELKFSVQAGSNTKDWDLTTK